MQLAAHELRHVLSFPLLAHKKISCLPAPASLSSILSIAGGKRERERRLKILARKRQEEEGWGGGMSKKKKVKKKGDVRVPRYQEHEITHVSVECLQEFLYFPFALCLSLQKTPAYISPSPSCFFRSSLIYLLQLKGKEAGGGRETG